MPLQSQLFVLLYLCDLMALPYLTNATFLTDKIMTLSLVFAKMSGNEDSSKHEFSTKNFGTRHLQVFLMFLGAAQTFAARYSISVAVVAMTDVNSTNTDYPTYNWDSEEKAIVLSSFFWTYVITQIPSGIFADIYSAHKIACCGAFVSSLVNLLTPTSVYYFGWTGMIICRLLMGILQSGILPCSHAFYSKWIPYEERTRIGSFANTGPLFGNVVTLTASGWLASSTLGWPSIFYVFGGFGILWSISFYYLAADSPAKHKTISPDERDYIEKSLNKSTGGGIKPTKVPWKTMPTSLPLWTLIVASCGHGWGYLIFVNKLPAYIKYALGYDIDQSGVISGLPYIATIVLTFIFGRICDFALKNGVALCIVRKVANTVAMWGASVALLALCLIPITNSTLVTLAILILIVGLDAGNYCGFYLNHIDLAPNFAGAQLGIFNAAGAAFGLTAPLVCGYIVTDESNLHQWHVIFYITAGTYFLANLFFVVFGQTNVQPWNN